MYDKILIGIGKEWKGETAGVEKLAQILTGKDYFIITSLEETTELQKYFPEDRLTYPGVEEMEGWEEYQKWLAFTLNKNLLVLELGEGFANPGLIRFPFEKVTYFNQKSKMYRVNATFPQISDEIAARATAVKKNSVAFVMEDLEELC